MRREENPAYYRPEIRRLISLSNEELQALFVMRAKKVQIPPTMWEDNRIVFHYRSMMDALSDLYEVMLEIQARYPKGEADPEDRGSYFKEFLPLKEPQWVRVAMRIMKVLPCGLKESV